MCKEAMKPSRGKTEAFWSKKCTIARGVKQSSIEIRSYPIEMRALRNWGIEAAEKEGGELALIVLTLSEVPEVEILTPVPNNSFFAKKPYEKKSPMETRSKDF